MPDTTDDPIGTLLSRANLARVRGNWDEAFAMCRAAIEHAPASSEAHAFLGELYAAQGKDDEALHFFSLAVDLKPDAGVVREKRDKLLQAKRDRLIATQKQAEPVPTPKPTHPQKATTKPKPRTLQIALLVFGGIVMLLLGVWLGTYLANRNNELRPSKEPGTVGRG